VAIQKVLKFYITCPSDNRQKILESLQRWGKSEIIEVKEEEHREETRVSDSLHYLRDIIDFLERYKEKESLWNRLKNGLPGIETSRIKELEKQIDIESDHNRLIHIKKQIGEIEEKISKNEKLLSGLGEIKNIDLTLKMIEFREVSVFIARLEKEAEEKILESEEIYAEKLSDSDRPIYALFYLKSSEEKISEDIHKFGIHKEMLDRDNTPSERINLLDGENRHLIKEKQKLLGEVSGVFMPKYSDYKILQDVYENRENLRQQEKKAIETLYTSTISGWVPEVLKENLAGIIQKASPVSYMQFSKPEKGDHPPVLLSNGSFSRPFEVVTELYGTPSYRWVDPTPLLAPFFAFFFGICLTDAGYGLIIAAVSIWALKKLKLGAGAVKFMKLMMWGGFASVIAGALTGGWFGNVLAGVPAVMNLRILDPLEKPQYFLYFSVALGFVHIVFGIFISMVKKIEAKEYKSAFYEEFPWILVLTGLPLFAASKILQGFSSFSGFFSAIISAGIAGVVFLSGHENRNIFGRIGAGLYSLYGGTDYFKDMISYSRLFALGMGTGILAMAVNEISGMLLGIPFVGIILVAVIFTAGHVFNILMNILSGYVHTSRLQYVEFFTKFFKGGGRSFDPFVWKGKNVRIKE